MNFFIGVLALHCASSLAVSQESTDQSNASYFTVAVFEHARLGNTSVDTPSEIINMNLQFYNEAAKLAREKDADMIVFPEYGIFPLLGRTAMKAYLETIPDPDGKKNPCTEEEEFKSRFMLRNLSCLAMNNKMVVVANVGDMQSCQSNSEDNECPEDGEYHYNANVVFDQRGNIISRYWKERLFFESGMDLPTKPQNPTFVTDFGRFGHFVCFDSLFKHIVDVGKNHNVDAVLLPTWWGNMLPVYNSVQFWMAWALGNDATFIAANIQMPGSGTTGSGVFHGKLGAIKYTFNPDGSSKLLVSRVPKSRNPALPFLNPSADVTVITAAGPKKYDEDSINFDTYLPERCSKEILGEPKNNYADYRCFYENMENYTFVKLSKPQDRLQACNNGMCCSVEYSMDATNETFYLGVLNGTYNSVEYYQWCTENCIVARCESYKGKECAVLPSYSSTKFHRLKLSANFSTQTVYPSVVRTGMRLTSLKEWNFGLTHGNKGTYQASINFTSTPESKALVIAAFNARCFDRDPPYVP